MAQVLLKASAYVFVIALGYILKRLRFFKPDDYKLILKITLNITMPAAVITNFAAFEFDFSLLFAVLLALGSYFAQLAEVLSQEDAASPELLSLILNALYALAKLRKPPRLVKAATELRLAAIAGYEPELSGCCVCGSPQPDRFSIADGTLLCAGCRAGDGVRMPLSEASLAAMRYILRCPEKRLFSFSLTGAAEKELCDAAESYLLTQLERSFYTLDFYKSLCIE